MKRWKDGKNRYELHLNGKECAVLYYNVDTKLFYVRSYIMNGSSEALLSANNTATAKAEAEKWLVKQYRKIIQNCESQAKNYKERMQTLVEDSAFQPGNERNNITKFMYLTCIAQNISYVLQSIFTIEDLKSKIKELQAKIAIEQRCNTCEAKYECPAYDTGVIYPCPHYEDQNHVDLYRNIPRNGEDWNDGTKE